MRCSHPQAVVPAVTTGLAQLAVLWLEYCTGDPPLPEQGSLALSGGQSSGQLEANSFTRVRPPPWTAPKPLPPGCS